MRLLVDHRERLVAQRTALINDLRWGLHDLWPEFEIPPRALTGPRWQERVAGRLARADQSTRVRIARDELRRIRELTRAINELERELAPLVAELAPGLVAERGCGVLTAAKLIGEIAGVERFATDAKLARTAGQRRSRPPRAAPTATASTAAATASSTAPAPARRLQIAPGPRDRRLPRPQAGRGQDPPRSAALPQAPPRPPRLQAPAPAHTSPAPDPSTPLGDRPPVIAKAGRMIHCNTPAGTPVLT